MDELREIPPNPRIFLDLGPGLFQRISKPDGIGNLLMAGKPQDLPDFCSTAGLLKALMTWKPMPGIPKRATSSEARTPG